MIYSHPSRIATRRHPISSPGGREIARVSVRVVANTDGVKKKIEAELKSIKDFAIDVNVRLNTAKTKAELDKLQSEHPTIDASLTLDDAAAKAQKDAFGRPIKVQANVDLDDAAAKIKLAALGAKRIKITANVDVDRNLFSRIGSDITGAIGGAFGKVAAAGDQAFSSLSGAAGGLSSALGPIAGTVGGIATGLVKASAGAFAMAEAGFAIVTAYGAASTAIAAIPAAIGFIGAPLAAVHFGLDGIKKAAKEAGVSIDDLKKPISATFEKGLLPVFKQLKPAFQGLVTGLQGTATALIGVSQRTADWITKGPGLAQINTMFTNINTTIGQIDLIPLLDGFTKLAGNTAGLNVLRTAVDTVGQSLLAISQNKDLNSAFDGLSGIVRELGGAFTDLVNHGITSFSAAAPGATAGIRGLRDGLDKFDWKAIGGAAGKAMQGLGDAIATIPQPTVDKISQGITDLGTTLSNPAFQQGVHDWAALVPDLLKIAGALVTIGGAIPDIATSKWTWLFVAPGSALIDLGRKAVMGGDDVNLGVNTAQTALQNLDSTASDHFTRSAASAEAGMGRMSDATKTGAATTVSNLDTGLAPGAGVVTHGTQAMVDAANKAIPGLGTAFGTGFAQLGPLVDAAFAALNTANIPVGLQGMSAAITQGFTGVIGPAFTTAFATLGPIVQGAFLALSTVAIPLGLGQLAKGITAGFTTTIGPAFTNGFLTNVTPAVTQAFLALGVTFSVGMTELGLALTGEMTKLGTAFTNGFTVTIVPAVTAGFVLVNTAFTTGFTNIATTSVSPGMVKVAQAVTAGFLGVIAAVTDGMNAAVVSANVGFTELTQTATTGMASFTTEIKTGATNVLTEVTDMVDKAIAEANKLEAGFKTAGSNAVAAMAASIRAGKSEVINASTEVAQAAIQAANDKLKINSPSREFWDVGSGIDEGWAGGVLDNKKMVVSAVNSVGDAAIRAGQDQFDTFGALQFSAGLANDFGNNVVAQVNGIITDGRKAQTIQATIPVYLDGKLMRTEAKTVIAEWEKELLTAKRGA